MVLMEAFIVHDLFKDCRTFQNLQIISVFTDSGYDFLKKICLENLLSGCGVQRVKKVLKSLKFTSMNSAEMLLHAYYVEEIVFYSLTLCTV